MKRCRAGDSQAHSGLLRGQDNGSEVVLSNSRAGWWKGACPHGTDVGNSTAAFPSGWKEDCLPLARPYLLGVRSSSLPLNTDAALPRLSSYQVKEQGCSRSRLQGPQRLSPTSQHPLQAWPVTPGTAKQQHALEQPLPRLQSSHVSQDPGRTFPPCIPQCLSILLFQHITQPSLELTALLPPECWLLSYA